MSDEIVFLDRERLDTLGSTLAPTYSSAAPFPHVVIDDILAPDRYKMLREAFPGPEANLWYKFKSNRENKKLQSQTLDDLPWPIRLFLNEVNGATFTRFLERLTGIDGLVPDPHLYGGGLHQTLPGGHLGVHIDYNYHKTWNLDRRLNVILYFNDDWDDAWGGGLELWDREMTRCVERVMPQANRLVVFSTSEESWHGHPSPLACPAGETRKSIALYYYSNGRPDEERGGDHNTVFRARPGERFAPTAREIVADLVPPVLARAARRLTGKDGK